MSKLPVFDKYFTREDTDYYLHLFTTNGLHPFVDPPSESFNAIFGNTQVDLQYVLRLPVEEFETAVALIGKAIEKAGLPQDYYLHDYNNEALYDILKDTKSWSRQDVAAAAIVLKQRNFPIDENKLLEQKQAIKQEQKTQNQISLPVLVLFYVVAPVGSVLAVFVGLVIYFIKDIDLDGQKDFVFTDRYRRHGLWISLIGVASVLAWLFKFNAL